MTTSPKLKKIARYLLLLNSFLMVVYGIVVIVQPDLFTDNLEVYTGLKLEELSMTHERLTKYIDLVVQLNGAFNLLLGLIGLIAVYQSFKARPWWLLFIIFVTNLLGYLAPMTFDQLTGVIRYPEKIAIISFGFSVIAFMIIMPDFRKQST